MQVTVRVPASTSNLGPGFDCLGVALRIYNTVTVRRGGTSPNEPMLREAADLFFERSECRSFPFSVTIGGDVPVARGLGSSVTVRLGLMHGLNALASGPLHRREVFQLCAELEGHPDNAAPAEFGGFNVAHGALHQRFSVSAMLKFILLVPDFEVRTSDARALLPNRIAREGAIESCGNACMITAAFASSRYEYLRHAFRDHLHQPFRKKLVPYFDDVVAAAEEAGALGAFLSGSGSTIAAVTLSSVETIAAAMHAAAGDVPAETIVTAADNQGAVLLQTRRPAFERRTRK
ncbi:MAG TPA: homoserine kinase [Chthoniobacterales bacterium]|nr:homoserine kinase [Chthoniobacterales bacterium]